MLAISQPAHAWISGQLHARGSTTPLSETLLLAGEQHDIGWLDWERAPTFDAAAGRPPSFREVARARPRADVDARASSGRSPPGGRRSR